MLLWLDTDCDIYFAMRDKATDSWRYFAGNVSHGLDAGRKMTEYASEANAQTNYLTTTKDANGKVAAIIPNSGVKVRTLRLFVQSGSNVTIWEWVPSPEFKADQIVTGELEITDQYSSAPLIKVTASSIDRVKIGKIDSSTYGVVGYDNNSATVFELSDNKREIAGWTFTATKFKSPDDSIELNAASNFIQLYDGTYNRVRVGALATPTDYGIDVRDYKNNKVLYVDSSSAYIRWKSIGGRPVVTVATNLDEGEYTNIASAVDSLSDTGGRVSIKSGIYSINATIVIPDQDIDIEGANRESVVLSCAASMFSCFNASGNSQTNRFSNFTIQSNNTAATQQTRMILATEHTGRVFVDNVKFDMTPLNTTVGIVVILLLLYIIIEESN